MLDYSSEEEHNVEIHQGSSSSEVHLDSDEEINKAYEESVKEESILPILKQELRWKIQTRRLSEGQEELKSEIPELKVYELTEEEKEKNRRRLEQNRKSLRRSKIKELQHETKLKMKYNIETSKKEMLQRQKEELLKQKENLLKRLHNAGLEFDENTSLITCQFCKRTHLFSKR